MVSGASEDQMSQSLYGVYWTFFQLINVADKLDNTQHYTVS